MKLKPTLHSVLMKHINKDTYVTISKSYTSRQCEHYQNVYECLSSNIHRLDKKVKGYRYYVDGLLDIVM